MADTTNNKTTADNVISRVFLGKVLGLERHEVGAVAWSFFYFFCILSSYYMLRPMREGFGVDSGVATIPILFSSTFIVMMLASPVFGWIASRYPRRQFLPWVYYFFAANILLFYAVFSYFEANGLDKVWIGRIFFVWISVFNLFVVSVFWSFMADIYTREQGRRLFGVISAGGSIGALVGPAVTSQLVVPVGFANLLPISAALLLLSVVCITNLRRWVAVVRTGEGLDTIATRKPLGGTALAGLSHVMKSRYLGSIAIISVIASLLGTALYMFANMMVGDAVQGTDERIRIFSFIDTFTSALTIVFQLLVLRHAVKAMGIGVTLCLMPVVTIVGFALLAANPALLIVGLFQGIRRAVGFGFSKPTTDMLYSVVTPEEKYKAKNFIDTAVYRFGDVIGSWTIKALLGFGVAGISIIMIPFAAIWVLLSLWLGKAYRQRARSGKFNST